MLQHAFSLLFIFWEYPKGDGALRRSLGAGGTGEICKRLMHCWRRVLLRISVSSATDEVFLVVKDLGLSE